MILWALADRELSVGEIAEAIGSSMQNTSKHLRLMKDKGILASRREANFIYYQIAPNALMKGCRLLQQASSASAFPQQQNDFVTESIPTEIEEDFPWLLQT
jgi:ArsR family transcriptional regulator